MIRWGQTPNTMTAQSYSSPELATPLDGVVRGASPHDCPDTCAMLVTVENGRAIRVAGDPDHPFTQGFLCATVNRYVARTYQDRKSTRLNSSHLVISYAVFRLQ